MRNKTARFIYLAAILSILLPVGLAQAFSGAGSGTEEDPYIITNVLQLQEMNDDLDAWYELGNDIDASATKNWNDGKGFVPIGNMNEFTGSFDGREHIVTGLYINRPDANYVALFGCTQSGFGDGCMGIKNLGIVECEITGNNTVGALIGFGNSSISHCYATGSVYGNNYVGGLVGVAICVINTCYFDGNVNGVYNVGGLIGHSQGSSANACYSKGSVIDGDSVGGLIGNSNWDSITNCYSTVSVQGYYAGGLIGYIWDSIISNCYSTGSVSGNEYVGGLVGVSSGSCNDCFWDTETSGCETSAGGTGKTTAEMKQQATFTNWDFDTIWDIVEAVTYPFLRENNQYSERDNYVDLGNPEDEVFHNLQGWGGAQGPPENPYASPSGDQTKRYQLLRQENSVELSVEKTGVPYLLIAEVEDGVCSDNFEIYVNGQGPIYSYTATSKIGVVGHELEIPANCVTSTIVTVTFKNTSADDCGLAAVYNVKLSPFEPWSFAIITDPHIGDKTGDYFLKDIGILGEAIVYDYADDGWFDGESGAMDHRAARYLQEDVNLVNLSKNKYNVEFVVVLGDLTDSAELSELYLAKGILDGLEVPWIPIIGNHDVWPQAGLVPLAGSWAPKSDPVAGVGPDAYFHEVFGDQYGSFRDDPRLKYNLSNWERPSFPLWNDTLIPFRGSYFENFAFDYKGYHFVGLDFNRRDFFPAPGVPPDADLHDYNGVNDRPATWAWFKEHLKSYVGSDKDSGSGENIILLAHHPFRQWKKVPFRNPHLGLWEMGFSVDKLIKMFDEVIGKYKGRLWTEFAGHSHESREGWFADKWFGKPIEVVETEATVDVPSVRIVRFYPEVKSDEINKHYCKIVPEGGLYIMLACPADLEIMDPEGLLINKSMSEIPHSIYSKEDTDHDGSPEDSVYIRDRKLGNYQISVIPEPDADSNDTYTLKVAMCEDSTGWVPMVLAQDVPIEDIPAEPYVFESKLNRSDLDIDGDVDFADYAVFASHWMNQDCSYPGWCEGKDLDYSGVVDVNDLAIFVDNWLWEKIIADFDIDGDVDFGDYAAFAAHWRDVGCNEPDWCSGADLNKSGSVDLYDLAEFAEYWLEGL